MTENDVLLSTHIASADIRTTRVCDSHGKLNGGGRFCPVALGSACM